MTTDPHSPLPDVSPPQVWRRYDCWRARRHDAFVRKHGHRLPNWHNRRGARRAVAALCISLAYIGVSAVLAFFTWWFAVPFAIGLIGCIASQYAVRIVSGSVADTPAAALDELQLAQRNAARSMSFGILVALMFIPYFILVTLSGRYSDGVPPQFVYGTAITLITLLLIGTMIPTILTAWWTHDPDDDADPKGDYR